MPDGDASGQLVVEFIGDVRVLELGSTLTFGRGAELVIDDANPFLHRVVGEFRFDSAIWWIHNHGEKTPLVVIGDHGTRIEIAPSGSAPMPRGESRVLFEAGSARYELACSQADAPLVDAPLTDVVGDATTDWGVVPLNYEQRLLLIALCEQELKGFDLAVPSNKALATRLGWSAKKVERKFDYLCTRYADAGVMGLKGGAGADAGDRRRKLAEHVMRFKFVSSDDLDLLDVRDGSAPET